MIISSWYLCDKQFKSIRVFKSWFSTFLYSVIVGCFYLFRGEVNFFIFHFLPISTNVVWFMRAYIILLLLTPLLNYLLNIPKLKNYLIVFLAIFSFYLTLYPGNSLVLGDWEIFVLIYLITGYVKKYHQNLLNKNIWLPVFISLYFLNILWYVFYYEITNALPILLKVGYNRYMFNNYTSNIQCLFSAFALFFCFKNIKIKTNIVNRIVEFISSYTLDIYILLSINSPSGILWWIEIFGVNQWIYGKHLMLKIYCLIIIVYLTTLLIGFLRSNLEKIIFSNKMISKLCKKIDDFYM